jgi:hypothetical protein
MKKNPCIASVPFVSFALLTLLGGCGANRIRIESEPDGAAAVVRRPGMAPAKLGTTPVEIVTSTYPELFGSDAQITIEKEGHEDATFIIPKTALRSDIRIRATLKDHPLPLACTQAEQSLAEIAEGVAYAQGLLAHKSYNEAKAAVQNLVAKYPKISVLYDLLGNAHYLSKDLDRALEAYSKSRDLRPGNSETVKMIQKITLIRGGK